MKKSIEVKGIIKVDKSEMKEIRAGSCGQAGIACTNVHPAKQQSQRMGVVIVDDLYLA